MDLLIPSGRLRPTLSSNSAVTNSGSVGNDLLIPAAPPLPYYSNNNLPPPPLPPQIPLPNTAIQPLYTGTLDPNSKLDLCCRKQGVSPVCQSMCNFDTFTDRSLVHAVISNQCPGPQLGQAFDCATSKVDHSECCRRAGIHQYNGGQCLPFCETHVPTPPNVLSYFACLQVFETIKTCYRDYQSTHVNIYGD